MARHMSRLRNVSCAEHLYLSDAEDGSAAKPEKLLKPLIPEPYMLRSKRALRLNRNLEAPTKMQIFLACAALRSLRRE